MIKQPIDFLKFRKDFDSTVKELAKKYNIEIKLGGIRYSETYFSAKIDAKIQGAAGKQEVAYERFKVTYDLPELNTRYISNGRTFEITGFNPRKSRFPVLVKEITTGKNFCTTVELVKLYSKMK